MGFFRDALNWMGSPSNQTRASHGYPREIDPSNIWNGNFGTNRPVSDKEALQLAAVYRAVTVISTGIMQLGVRVRKNKVEIDDIPLFLRKPDTNTTMHTFLESTATSLALKGNAYWLVNTVRRGGADVPLSLQLLPYEEVEPKGDVLGNTIEIRWRGKNYNTKQFRHLKLMRVGGDVKGLGPIQAAMRSMRGALDAEQYANEFYENSGIPTGVLKTKGPLPDQSTLQKMQRQWTETVKLKNGVVVLADDFEYSKMSLSPAEMQFIEVRNYNITDMARLFSVDANLMIAPVAGSNLTYTNVEQAWIAFVRFGLMKYIAEIEDALSSLLPDGQDVKLNSDALLRADTKSRAEVHNLAKQWMTLDEIRAIEGLPALTPEQRAELNARNIKAQGAPKSNADSKAAEDEDPPDGGDTPVPAGT